MCVACRARGCKKLFNACPVATNRVHTYVRTFGPSNLGRLETPTVVWNSECRHMLGVVLRELEGATPGLQDVPEIEVHEVLYGRARLWLVGVV